MAKKHTRVDESEFGDSPTDRYRRLLKDLIEERGLTQEAAGKAFGISQGYVNQVLNTPGKDVGVSRVADISRKLGLDPDYFFDLIPRGTGSYKEYLLVARDAPPVSEVRVVDQELAEASRKKLGT